MTIRVKKFTVLLPYGAIGFGLHILHSAWAAVILYHVAAAGLAGRAQWNGLRGGWRWRWILALSAVCALAGVLVQALWPWAGGGRDLSAVLSGWGLQGTSWVLFAAYLSVVHPIVEEVVWRGVGEQRARWLSWRDVAFAGYHALVLPSLLGPLWVIVALAGLTVAAALWRIAAVRTGGLGAAVVSHGVADFAIVIAAHVIMRAGPATIL